MDLSLTPSQILIRDSARSFVQRHVPRAELVRQAEEGQTWDPAWFEQFPGGRMDRRAGADMQFGGLDLDPLSAALIFEELGRGAVPSPLIASSVIAACLLRGCQASEQRDAALAAIADGSMILVPALRKPETSWNGVAATGTALTKSNGTWILTGSKVFVPFADAATHFLVSVAIPGNAGAGTGNRSGRYRRDRDPVAAWLYSGEPRGRFQQHRGRGRSHRSRRRASHLTTALAVARVVVAAYQVGGMLEMLDMSVDSQQHARAVRHADRPLSARAGPHHTFAERHGCREDGRLTKPPGQSRPVGTALPVAIWPHRPPATVISKRPMRRTKCTRRSAATHGMVSRSTRGFPGQCTSCLVRPPGSGSRWQTLWAGKTGTQVFGADRRTENL